MHTITVKLDTFEGPFDLLFHLIEKNKIDIYDIPISKLTDQYIEYINSIQKSDMESMSEFLLMAATLVEIKSKMLLPKTVEEAYDDPRDELVNKLIEYKKFKQAAITFEKIQLSSGREIYKKKDESITNFLKENKLFNLNDMLDGINIDTLYKAFEDVLKRQDIKTDKIRSKFDSVSKDLYTIEDKMEYIQDLLILNKEIKFNKIFRIDSNKSEIVVTFLAILELIKIKKIKAVQKDIFDEIIISFY